MRSVWLDLNHFRQLGELRSKLPELASLVFCDQIRSTEGLGLEFIVASCGVNPFSNLRKKCIVLDVWIHVDCASD